MITQKRITDAICRVEVHRVNGTNTIIVALVLMNGHVVIGQAHCAESTDFALQVGVETARADAEQQVAALLAYQDRGFIKENGNG